MFNLFVIPLRDLVDTRTIKTFNYSTRNEHGKEEFSISFEPTLCQKLFKRAGTSLVFERPQFDMETLSDYVWREKVTGKYVDADFYIAEMIREIKRT